MDIFLYEAANVFFFVFHLLLILFNTFGWLFKKLRIYNLITLSLTAFSWFILGIWYGWGYCFCTDWHWQVRRKLGYFDTQSSYTDFLVTKLTGIDFPDDLVNTVTASVFGVSIVMSALLNFRDFRKLQ